MEYFSAEYIGHAVDTLRVTETHERTAVDVAIGSHPCSDGGREGVASDDVTIGHHPTVAKSTGLGSPFGGRGRKRYEHGGEVTAQLREELNPEILDMMAENFTSNIEPSDYNNYKVDNCPEKTESLLSDGFGERGK